MPNLNFLGLYIKNILFRHSIRFSVFCYDFRHLIMSENDGYSKAKEYVCENFRWGPMDFCGRIHVKCLKVFGYKNFSENGPGKCRFAIWSGDQTNREKDIIRATFNSSKNDNSSQIQIIIGSPSIKEGVNLLRVKQVHILEAYWNHSRLEQIYGRAVRFCSHKTLSKDERNVIIYIYAAICKQNKKITPKESIDLYMLEMADKKKEEMAPYVLSLQEVAVDRLLFS